MCHMYDFRIKSGVQPPNQYRENVMKNMLSTILMIFTWNTKLPQWMCIILMAIFIEFNDSNFVILMDTQMTVK